MSSRESIGVTAPREIIGHYLFAAVIYVVLGKLSFTTAFVQTNTAAVWLPSGFALGLLIVFGISYWPAIALGSFVLNAMTNLGGGGPVTASLLVAFFIALGNTAEATLGAVITNRFAHGRAFFTRSRGIEVFTVAALPLAPLVSMVVGVTASDLGGLSSPGSLPEIMLTWYVANAVGLLILTGPVVALLTRPIVAKPPRGFGSLFEAFILAMCLIFASQAICGLYVSEAIKGFPKAYMIVPFLFWACFRFGTYGAFASILVVAVISIVGTMQGFEAFPAETPSRALIYLQVFLGMLSIMTLAISAALNETWDLQHNLELKIQARTQVLEGYIRQKENFTTLVAHDLQSPLYGIRNALRAAAEAIGSGRMTPPELGSAFAMLDKTCSALAERVGSLLTTVSTADDRSIGELSSIVRNIGVAHHLTMNGKGAALRLAGDLSTRVHAPDQVEHILDTLVDNAIKFSPAGTLITIDARFDDDTIEIVVSDEGPGLSPAAIGNLFQARPRDATGAPRSGLGLYLAKEQAQGLGGDLSYVPGQAPGAAFSLVLPLNPVV